MNEYRYNLLGEYKNGNKYEETSLDIYELTQSLNDICEANKYQIDNSDSPLPHSMHFEQFKMNMKG